jgi:hypothetical protein
VLLSLEDNDDDYLHQTAIEEWGLSVKLRRAADGEQAFSFLLRTEATKAPSGLRDPA